MNKKQIKVSCLINTSNRREFMAENLEHEQPQNNKNNRTKTLQQKLSDKFVEDAKVECENKQMFSFTVSIFYVESLINKKMFSDNVEGQIEKFLQKKQDISDAKEIMKKLKTEISVSSIKEVTSQKECLNDILSGNVLIICENAALSIPIKNIEKRAVAEPPTSQVIKGPREGFVEDISVNLNLIRKRLKTTNIRIKDHYVGRQTHTQISVIYLDGIAQDEIVKDIETRIDNIDIDGIIDSYYIESFLEDKKLKFFKRVGNTEKPDILCAKLLEGRIGILVDGSPIALTAPYVLFEDLQSSEDYYTIPAMATFARVMRLVGLFFAILMPGIFVALQSYNYRILPINFLITLLSSIEGLSIPPLIEILVVLFLFEIITEASLQMPNALTMALSIIGALALGNTAVDAGIISPPSIVVVAVSSVALYIIPDQIAETRLLRILFTTLGGIIGLYGIVMAMIIVAAYMTSIKSFGVPYFAPFAPRVKNDIKDGFVKKPVQQMTTRPELIAGNNKVRQRTKKIRDYNFSIDSHKKGGSK